MREMEDDGVEDTLPRPLRPHNTSSKYLTHLPLPPLTPPPALSYHYVPLAPQRRGGADHDPLLVSAKVSSITQCTEGGDEGGDDGVGDGGAWGETGGEKAGEEYPDDDAVTGSGDEGGDGDGDGSGVTDGVVSVDAWADGTLEVRSDVPTDSSSSS